MSASLTLAELTAAYHAAREAASAAARYTSDEVPPATCRYCGRTRGAGSDDRDGHARCIVTREFQVALAKLWWSSPALTHKTIAYALGVPIHVVKRWTDPRRLEVSQCG